MLGRRKWWAVASVGMLVVAATAISALSRSQSAVAQQKAGAETATQKANREAQGKAVPGPWAYSGASGYTHYLGQGTGRSPEQPVKFPHPVHVNTLKMNCVFCHYAANKSPDPGMPALSTCMACHTIIGTDRPEIKKLTEYYNKKQPVPWVRVHKVPEYVHFPHMRHVNAGVTCQSCHGQVQNMPQVFQYASLNMGWCVTCHVNGYSRAEGLKAAGYASDTTLMRIAVANDEKLGRRRASYDCANCHY